MPKTQIDTRPAYYRGQLLLEDDFTAEQRYHVLARCHHNLRLHGWGVVSGLAVSARGDSAVVVGPGHAVDSQGREIEIRNEVDVDLADAAPNGTLAITLEYREDEEPEGHAPRKRIPCSAVIEASSSSVGSRQLLLATVRLDGKGKLTADSIDTAKVRYVRNTPSPGSVGAEALGEELRRGWLRVPFRPIPLEKGPKGEELIPPPFRVGATECRSYDDYEGKRNDRGAGGTMAIPVPPSARAVHRFRIAGEKNSGKIELKLVSGGWDPVRKAHLRRPLVIATIDTEPYEQTFDIADSAIDPEYHTLSIWLLGHGKTSVSFVAVEFSC